MPDTLTEPPATPLPTRRSESIAALAAALAKAQGEMQGAVKDSENPFFSSKYADLASVWDACRAALSKNGLAVIQMPRSDENGIEVETVLAHSSGEWMSETLRMPVVKTDAQKVGSAITYARRYALAAFVGVAPEDDDGNAAADSMAHKRAEALPPPQRDLTEEEQQKFDAWVSTIETEVTDLAACNLALEAWNKMPPKTLLRTRCWAALNELAKQQDFKIDNKHVMPGGGIKAQFVYAPRPE